MPTKNLQARAQGIANNLGLTGQIILPDKNNLSPFWVGDVLVLISSNSNTKAEVDNIDEAIQQKAKVIVVNYDFDDDTVLDSTETEAKTLAGTQVTPNEQDDLDDFAKMLGIDLDKKSKLSKKDQKEMDKFLKHLGGLGVMMPGMANPKPFSKLSKDEFDRVNDVVSSSVGCGWDSCGMSRTNRRHYSSGGCGSSGCGGSGYYSRHSYGCGGGGCGGGGC